MRLRKILVMLPALLLLAGCVGRNDFDSLKRDLDEMRARQIKADRELSIVRSDSREGMDKALKDARTELDGIRKVTADLQASMEAMKVDLRVLTGKTDDLSLQGKKPADDLALFKEEMDQRLIALDQILQGVSKQQEALLKEQKDVRKQAETPESIYQSGMDAFKMGDMKKARELFSRFVDIYPNNDLTANAVYWIGETYYSDKDYEQAILEFQKVIKNYPDKEKVAAAMLKQGMAFINLKDNKSAKHILEKLTKQFPTGEETRRARDQLKGLK